MSLIVAGGCGSDDEGAPGGARADAALPAAATPAPSACAAEALRTSARPDDLVPPAGDLAYATVGTRRSLGQGGGGSTPLPRRTAATISAARKVGRLRCFVVQRRYTPQLADNLTTVVRGGDVYLTRLQITAGGQVVEITPDPPIKTLDGDDLEWEGSFDGPTRGRYAGAVVGRRAVRVGDRAARAVGVELRIAFTGELRGSSRSTTWFSLDHNVVVDEKVTQKRALGIDRLRLDYRAKLRPGDLPA